MYPSQLPHNSVDVEPLFDRIVLFWSDGRTPHEVQPAFRNRSPWLQLSFIFRLWWHSIIESGFGFIVKLVLDSVNKCIGLLNLKLDLDLVKSVI